MIKNLNNVIDVDAAMLADHIGGVETSSSIPLSPEHLGNDTADTDIFGLNELKSAMGTLEHIAAAGQAAGSAQTDKRWGWAQEGG